MPHDFVKVRSVDAPGEYLVTRSRAAKFPDRYILVDAPVEPPANPVQDTEPKAPTE